MKKLLVILSSVLFVACKDDRRCKPETKVVVWKVQIDSVSEQTQIDMGHIEILTIDGCEYLYCPNGSATVLTHKGNCKNHKQ